MPHPEFDRFAKIVDGDERLRDELWKITDPAQFVSEAVRRASERGIVLTDADVWEAFHEGRSSWLATQMP